MNKQLVKHPIITEKATRLSGLGQYLFLVSNNANKPEVKKVIEGVYKVTVEKVRIITVKPKKLRVGKILGEKKGYKKAIVTLKKGQTLDFMPS